MFEGELNNNNNLSCITLTALENFGPSDAKFQELKALEPPPFSRPPFPYWMLEELLQLIEKRTSLCRNDQYNWNMAHTLTKAICKSLLVNSRKQSKRFA